MIDPNPIAPPIPLLYQAQDVVQVISLLALLIVLTLAAFYGLSYYWERKQRPTRLSSHPAAYWQPVYVPVFLIALGVFAMSGLLAMMLPDGVPPA